MVCTHQTDTLCHVKYCGTDNCGTDTAVLMGARELAPGMGAGVITPGSELGFFDCIRGFQDNSLCLMQCHQST